MQIRCAFHAAVAFAIVAVAVPLLGLGAAAAWLGRRV